jgi:hypothetical protein
MGDVVKFPALGHPTPSHPRHSRTGRDQQQPKLHLWVRFLRGLRRLDARSREGARTAVMILHDPHADPRLTLRHARPDRDHFNAGRSKPLTTGAASTRTNNYRRVDSHSTAADVPGGNNSCQRRLTLGTQLLDFFRFNLLR